MDATHWHNIMRYSVLPRLVVVVGRAQEHIVIADHNGYGLPSICKLIDTMGPGWCRCTSMAPNAAPKERARIEQLCGASGHLMR